MFHGGGFGAMALRSFDKWAVFGAVSLAMFLCSLIMRAILQLRLLARGSR